MNQSVAILGGLSALGAASSLSEAEKMGWRLGVQAFSFYQVSFFETLDWLLSIGIRHVEAMPMQQLAKDDAAVRFSHNSPPEVLEQVKAKLEETGVTLVNYGVVELPNDEAECRKVFDFATEMGIETIVSEPPDEALGLIDRLCGEYGINLAIHNHPTPNDNWDPDKVLAECEGRSRRIGGCVDTSHWTRSGVDVLEALRKFEGRIVTLHFGDVNAEKLAAFMKRLEEPKEGDTPPTMVDRIRRIPNAVHGEGPGDMMAWLAELKRQDVKAVFSIEAFFELEPSEAAKKIAACAQYFEKAAAKLAGG